MTTAQTPQVPRNPLIGKEVVLQRTNSSRFNAVATFPLQPPARKREFVECARASPSSSTPGDIPMDMPRAKRQRVFASEPTPLSFTEKVANWLLPAKPAATGAVGQPFGSAAVGDAPASSYPFKQQPQQQQSMDKRRAKKPAIGARPKSQKTSSVFQTVEKWLFTEGENKAPN